ncbi:MAG: hypothetical protein ACOYB2_10400 [Limnohabitans sp.]
MAERTSVEASDLGLAPGEWPTEVQFEGRTHRLIEVVRDRDGDVTHAEYDGLTVWND